MKPLHGIVSVLDEVHSAKVQAIWHELQAECGLGGMLVTPVPHFSWQIAEQYDIERVKRTLGIIVRRTRPFVVHTAGLGMFSGNSPVIYIPLVKSGNLLHYHQLVWRRTRRAGKGFSPNYTPASWMPHITLAHGGVNENKLGCALQKLSFRQFVWEIQVDNLAFMYQPEKNAGYIQFGYHFGG